MIPGFEAAGIGEFVAEKAEGVLSGGEALLARLSGEGEGIAEKAEDVLSGGDALLARLSGEGEGIAEKAEGVLSGGDALWDRLSREEGRVFRPDYYVEDGPKPPYDHEAYRHIEDELHSTPKWMDPPSDAKDRPSPQASEAKALEIYGGDAQKSYKDGKEVPYGTPGSTRPDIVRQNGDAKEAIEVKNYNLEDPKQVAALIKELQRQIGQRVTDLPEGFLQRVVLDVRGLDLSPEELADIVNEIKESCADIYPDLPVDLIEE